MIYLSFDIEATGLDENDYIIEFACVPFSTDGQLYKELTFHHYIKCPSFEILKPNLNPWVVKHNEALIRTASSSGLTIEVFKRKLSEYLETKEMKSLFDYQKITLFGKSMAAIDLPFLSRDLGWGFMRQYFEHRQLDLSSVAYTLIDMKKIPEDCSSGSFLMSYLGFGDVAHTALEDAENTAYMYLKLLKKNN